MRSANRASARLRGVCAAALTAGLCAATPGATEAPDPPPRPTHNMFGMTGLIETPTAEMQPDGQISFTTNYFAGFNRNTLSVQILPGVEAAFRYSILEDILEGQGTLYDRSFDIKLRLVEEGDTTPAVALGLQDFLGTGTFSSEYIVATKRFFGDTVSLSGGIGWGRFAGLNGLSNPACDMFDTFCDRDDRTDTGGNVNFGQYFAGEDIGLFGGVEWRTPIDGLSVKLEYTGDEYQREQRFSDFDPELPVNLGINYRPLDGVELGAQWLFGTAFGARVTLSGNPFDPPAPTAIEEGPPPLVPRQQPRGTDRRAGLGFVQDMTGAAAPSTRFATGPVADYTVETRLDGIRWATATLRPAEGRVCPVRDTLAMDAELGQLDAVTIRSADGTVVCTLALRPAGEDAIRLVRRDATRHPTGWHANPERHAALRAAVAEGMAKENLELAGFELGPERVRLLMRNPRYAELPKALGRTARVLAGELPPSVRWFEIVPMQQGLPVLNVTLDRGALEDQVNRPDAARKSWLAAEVGDAEPLGGALARDALDQYPRLSWSINPAVPVNLFDPDDPVRADLSLRAGASVEFAPGVSVSAAMRKRVVGMLDEIERGSGSVLPRVRSDFARYLDEGDPGLLRLTGDFLTKLSPSIYGRVSAGLLEEMFGGVSGEVLWKPANQPLGLGLEVNYARQRDFDMLFDFRDYDVVTGHVSLYWDTGFHGISTQIDGGRYLAGDWGGTLTVSRRFDNGWTIGGFATFTDVPFDEFGEGSFDKGIFFSIPLNWTLPYETRSTIGSVIRPLTRDGGQRLGVSKRLYGIVADESRNRLKADWGGFWE